MLYKLDETPATEMTLGQKWFGMKPVWHVASGGLHAGSVPDVLQQLGEDIMIQVWWWCFRTPLGD